MINNGKQEPEQDTQATKMRIGLIVVSTFLVHCGGTWAYAFFVILQQGVVSFYEPNGPWLVAEFGLAVVLTLLGFCFFGVAISGMRRKTEEK
jgi:hypothetical protein